MIDGSQGAPVSRRSSASFHDVELRGGVFATVKSTSAASRRRRPDQKRLAMDRRRLRCPDCRTQTPFSLDAGVLFLVVGPSGVRKGRADRCEMRRASTRPAISPTPADYAGRGRRAARIIPFVDARAEFDALRGRRSVLALSWRAHGLAYGVPISVATALARGRSALVNVSRSVIDAARDKFPPVRVLNVTAPKEVLATRLALRGRESPEEIAARLSRADRGAPRGDDVVVIDNGGVASTAAEAMARAIEREIGPAGDGALIPSAENDQGA